MLLLKIVVVVLKSGQANAWKEAAWGTVRNCYVIGKFAGSFCREC